MFNVHCYRSQTKFAKVMFLQVSVCPQGGGEWACVVAGGVCMVAGGACVVAGGEGVRRIRRDTVNERAVRILLECILVINFVVGIDY